MEQIKIPISWILSYENENYRTNSPLFVRSLFSARPSGSCPRFAFRRSGHFLYSLHLQRHFGGLVYSALPGWSDSYHRSDSLFPILNYPLCVLHDRCAGRLASRVLPSRCPGLLDVCSCRMFPFSHHRPYDQSWHKPAFLIL